jgi:hypothetical protein
VPVPAWIPYSFAIVIGVVATRDVTTGYMLVLML